MKFFIRAFSLHFRTPEHLIAVHHRGFIPFWMSVPFCALLAGCGGSAIHSPNQPVSLTISAAISLKEPLDAFA
ncbi:MAG TPA: hypothetical protein VKS00_02540, partial [Candidatus Acidoferrales bacterium]|nr:hypothetical protein [Candidatus Acidoferrales bacterium]